jgi:hypothetical protein
MKQLLVFVLTAGMLCWFMFAPVYKHVLIVRQATLQKEVDYLLEVGASARYGYIDKTLIDESKKRLENKGFISKDITYQVTTLSGKDGMDPRQPLLRGEGIKLEITYPYHQLFDIDQLIGLSVPDSSARMGANGMKMSEYVP